MGSRLEGDKRGIHRKCGQEGRKTVFYCNIWDENGGLNLEGKRKCLGSLVNLPVSLFCLAVVSPVKTCWCWMLA